MKLSQKVKEAVAMLGPPGSGKSLLVERLARHGRDLEAARTALAAAEHDHGEAALAHADGPTAQTRQKLDKAADALAAARRELETLEAAGRALIERQRSEEEREAQRSREQKRAEAIKQGARLLTLAGEADQAMAAFVAAMRALHSEVNDACRGNDLANFAIEFPLWSRALLGWQLPGLMKAPLFEPKHKHLADCVPSVADLLRAAGVDEK